MSRFAKPALRRYLAAACLTLASFGATAGPLVTVAKSATCGCCGKWVEHLKQNGFEVDVKLVDDVWAEHVRSGMPDKVASCHTARVAGYVIEGHVPAQDIRKLLATRPKALGIAVPSMPPGSPGMETTKPVSYETLLVAADGSTRVFAQH